MVNLDDTRFSRFHTTEGSFLLSMEWAYHQLEDKVAQVVLLELGSNEDQNLLRQKSWEDVQLRRKIVERGTNLLSDLVGRTAFYWYVRRFQAEQENSEMERWELTLATDCSLFPRLLEARKKTLRLTCTIDHEGRGKLRISKIQFFNTSGTQIGIHNRVSVPALIRLAPRIEGYKGIAQEFIAQVKDLPPWDPHKLDRDQLMVWEELLEFQRNLMKRRQYWVGYTNHTYREGATKVTFFLNKDEIKDSITEQLSYEEFQKRVSYSRKERLRHFTELPTMNNARQKRSQEIGNVEQFRADIASLTLNLEPRFVERLNHGRYNLSPSGYLHFEAYSDMFQIELQQKAVLDLKQGKASNPLLPDFFFDATKARPAPEVKHLLPGDLLSGTYNDEQIAAIEMAIAVPDLLLIQGSPGSGKTAVITEICYQVALTGGRTLIASQSNLAVDNALGRLIHNPHIRALRKGNANSVEEKGRDFMEERVIETWLSNTANDCQAKLEKRQKHIALFKMLLSEIASISQYHQTEIQWVTDNAILEKKQQDLIEKIAGIETEIQQSTEDVKKYILLQNTLSAIITGSLNWTRADHDEELQDTFRYLAETCDRQQFIIHINDCLQILKKMRLTPPTEGHLLRSVIWLKEIKHLYSKSWTKSRRYINQTEIIINELTSVDQQQKQREKVRQDKKAQQFLEKMDMDLSLLTKKRTEYTHQLTALFQMLSNRADVSEELRMFAQQHADSPITSLEFTQQYRNVYQHWLHDVQQVEALIERIWNEVKNVENKVQRQLAWSQAVFELQQLRLVPLQVETKTLEEELQQGQTQLLQQRRWWRHFWETIPENLRPTVPSEGIFALSFLKEVQQQFQAWEIELANQERFAQRYDGLVTDWITSLRTLSDPEKGELKNVYTTNANVIGITCGQVHKLSPKDLRAFSSFDVVIIDEASKATPPELLLPALKGKKLILIGDQHQLPPMIDDKTLDQMAEETGQDPLALRAINQSYFADRYKEAPDEIKCMLYTQYRMHPDIMAATNQFYERPLDCGLNQPDSERDHQLTSNLVRADKHLIWVTTPLISAHTHHQQAGEITARNKATNKKVFTHKSEYTSFGEEKVGTSYVNKREVEIIRKICENLQASWTHKTKAGAQPKEIGIITFYAAQQAELYKSLNPSKGGKSSQFDALNIRVSTVDRFQGMEREIIIVSMVRNNDQTDIGFAKKYERINVAFSRAQQLLIIVGCHDLFCDTSHGEDAAERYHNVSKIVRHRGDFIDVSSL